MPQHCNTSKRTILILLYFYKQHSRCKFDVLLMVPVVPNREKISSYFTRFALLQFCLNSAKTSKNRLYLYYVYKQYFRSKFDVFLRAQVGPGGERKSILNSLIVAILHSCLNSANEVKIDFILSIFYKQYFGFKFDLFLKVQAVSSRERN